MVATLGDYHVHALGHGEGEFTLGRLEEFALQAHKAGLAELGLAEHDELLHRFDGEVWASACRGNRPISLRLGLEVSFRPGRLREIRALATRYPFDYLIGSVHDLDGWPFDHPDYREGYQAWEIDELYREYFRVVAQAAQSGLFDVIGHLDLVKVFGYRSRRPVVELAAAALQAIADAGLAVEINTAGLFKPAAEIYPAEELLRACLARGIPITFGSDAHRAAEVGRELWRAAALARRVGYRSYVRFRRRRAELVPL
ncbi:MAG: histidinol-phosphatase HisJ family protein [Clostridia bacterium]|nr:histidinol-phosphatase HisJ family protein [Clostridia bacterium]